MTINLSDNLSDEKRAGTPVLWPLGGLPGMPGEGAGEPGSWDGIFDMTAFGEYAVDAWQRSILFMDLLRLRGNEQREMTSRPMATVLTFEHEILMSGRALPRPMNYSLARIVPPAGVEVDPTKRPVVVIDPRAGQGPGIGGFKTSSEIGEALKHGHAVYFIAFSAEPEPQQSFLDVVEGQVAFMEKVRELHPDALPPFTIGNCQAGYQTLMVAMLQPDLFGPVMVAGSPMSYWQGVRGTNPMRYSGGLLGGSWLTEMVSDMGMGRFDGSWLILNFDNLNPANWLWDKQYDVYANIDTEAQRYLGFERWWGDFITLNGREIQYLVDNLFIGDRLTRNELQSNDGRVFDLRDVTSPIIVFTSLGDNISPPPQTLGWILDLYRDVDDLRAHGRTVIYCLNRHVGHLAIFVSSKVGEKEDEEMVRLMDMLDCLPPGLFELVIEEAPEGSGQKWRSSIAARTFDDIRAFGRNSEEDDRAFEAVKRVSEINQSLYRATLQPMIRAMASPQMAETVFNLNPLRLSYTVFADTNPWMRSVADVAEQVRAERRPAQADNPFIRWQEILSDHINESLDSFREFRDRAVEESFYGIYSNPWLQAMLGMKTDRKVRERPGMTHRELAVRERYFDELRGRMTEGGFNEALIRAVVYMMSADRVLDERTLQALNDMRENLMGMPLKTFKEKVRNQFYILMLDGIDPPLMALREMLPDAESRRKCLELAGKIASADLILTAGEKQRLKKLEDILVPDGGSVDARAQTAPQPERTE